MLRTIAAVTLAVVSGLLGAGCAAYTGGHSIHWDSRDEIWLSEASQVKVRSAQSRVFEGSHKLEVLRAVVATLQDLDFQIAVLDEVLGIVSGKKFVDIQERDLRDPFYSLYNTESLLVFSKSYRSWGPFWHREDLVRLTVTVRERNETQLIVRAAAQFYVRPIEEPDPYQKFFRTLEQALFVDRELGDSGG